MGHCSRITPSNVRREGFETYRDFFEALVQNTDVWIKFLAGGNGFYEIHSAGLCAQTRIEAQDYVRAYMLFFMKNERLSPIAAREEVRLNMTSFLREYVATNIFKEVVGYYNDIITNHG